MDKAPNREGSLTRRILFRLDDGSVILSADRVYEDAAPGTAVRLSFDQAVDKGFGGEAQLKKLDDYISIISSSQPLAQQQQADLPPNKRHRSESQLSSGQAVSGLDGVKHADFVPKCLEIWKKVLSKLGKPQDQQIFMERVPDETPGYYALIKKPMYMRLIKEKLETGQYSDPQAFCDDMRQIWENCRMYNRADTYVAKVGVKGAHAFETIWIESGFSRGKRQTAGVAASKFEPELYTAPSKPKSSQKSQQPSKKQKGGLDKAMSHEVTSAVVNGGMNQHQGVTEERIQEIARLLPELDSDMLTGLLPHISAYYSIDEEGAFELDWENMQSDHATMMKVDKYLRSAMNTGPEPSHNPSVQLDRNSDSDSSDTEPDTD